MKKIITMVMLFSMLSTSVFAISNSNLQNILLPLYNTKVSNIKSELLTNKNAFEDTDNITGRLALGGAIEKLINNGHLFNFTATMQGKYLTKTLTPNQIVTKMVEYEKTLTKNEKARHLFFLMFRIMPANAVKGRSEAETASEIFTDFMFNTIVKSDYTMYNVLLKNYQLPLNIFRDNGSRVALLGTEEPAYKEYLALILTNRGNKAKKLLNNYFLKMDKDFKKIIEEEDGAIKIVDNNLRKIFYNTFLADL